MEHNRGIQMIEEITSGNSMFYILIGIFLIVICMCVYIILSGLRHNIKITILPLIGIVIGAVFLGAGMHENITYQHELMTQIESLNCDDLKEAYEMYKNSWIDEIITQKYVFECTDNPKEWWER